MTDGQRLQKCPARIRDRFHHFRHKQHATQTEDTCHHAMPIVPLHYDIWSITYLSTNDLFNAAKT